MGGAAADWMAVLGNGIGEGDGGQGGGAMGGGDGDHLELERPAWLRVVAHGHATIEGETAGDEDGVDPRLAQLYEVQMGTVEGRGWTNATGALRAMDLFFAKLFWEVKIDVLEAAKALLRLVFAERLKLMGDTLFECDLAALGMEPWTLRVMRAASTGSEWPDASGRTFHLQASQAVGAVLAAAASVVKEGGVTRDCGDWSALARWGADEDGLGTPS